ncbi:MAG: carbamoyltransferase [Candidatus Krumholzibacteriota bacterium]|nr:carbamoyltransferase [Candidatus Krumholzibacteriota bacterium]
MPERILGISAYYHDSAAALVEDGRIVAAAQEERFSRVKHDASFPSGAVAYVLGEAGLRCGDLDAVAFYDKPYLKFERLLETYHAFAPRGLRSFLAAAPVWIKEKLFIRKYIREELGRFGEGRPPILFPEHHLSHAASAFYPSPFEDAAILTIDGVGEWATTTIGRGTGGDIEILRELHFPHSLGLLYSAFTYYTGFRVNSGEYKLMGLAPYGDRVGERTRRFRRAILDELIDLREDGSLLLDMDYFRFATGLRMTENRRWKALFGVPPRRPGDPIDQVHMDMAAAIQSVTEEIVMRLARTAKRLAGSNRFCLAGGVALNSVANGLLLREGLFDDIWIQPAAGDAGGALGAALAARCIWKGSPRVRDERPDGMQGACLGPSFDERAIERDVRRYGATFRRIDDFGELARHAAGLIAGGSVVGWFQGRMEYGPRALGNRSILGDARSPDMQRKLNMKVKFREEFRPFAPTVLEEEIGTFFELDRPSPYMLLVVPVRESRRNELPGDFGEKGMYERLYFRRSDIPAVTHVDFSARVQSVARETNPRYWRLIEEFRLLTGYGVIVNTSFNVRGEPIVCTPGDAYRCFMRTGMDYLVMENLLFDKKEQSEPPSGLHFDDVFPPD